MKGIKKLLRYIILLLEALVKEKYGGQLPKEVEDEKPGDPGGD